MMEKDDPSHLAKILNEFRPTPKVTPRLHIRGSSARVSGTFPLCSEILTSTPSLLGPKDPFKRPFDDTVLNENDFLINRKRRKSLEDVSSDTSNISDTSVSASPWEVRRIKSELLEARAEVLNLESRISQLHGLRKQTEVAFDQEKASLKQTIDRDRSTITKLEERLRTVKRRGEKLKEELESILKTLTTENEELKERTVSLEEENIDLKVKLSELELKGRDVEREVSSLRAELNGVRAEGEAAKEAAATLSASLAPLKRSARQAEMDKAALTAAQMKISEMESELKNVAETAALVKTQERKLMRYSELEKQMLALAQEHVKLRQSTSNSVYLEGVIEELKIRLKGLSEAEREAKALRVEVGVMEGRLRDWTAVASKALLPASPAAGTPSSPTPSALAAYIKRLHCDHLEAVEKSSTLVAKMKTLEETHSRMKADEKSLEVELAKLRVELETSHNNIRRLKKQNTIVTWERNDLRSLVDSCQKEVTMGCLSVDPRIEALEKLVEGYRKRVDLFEKDDATGGGQGTASGAAELASLEKERDALKAKVEELQYELEGRALRGDFNVKDTKVLHLRCNPVNEALGKRGDELAVALAEVARLKERVKLLAEGQTADVTQAIEERVTQGSAKQVQELEERVRSAEVQNQRLREAFKAKSTEFREAVYCLLGYKVDSLPNRVYRLSSQYAESPEDHLVFKMSSFEKMELLETEFSSSLGKLIELHLNEHHSIPVFLSTITLELFQRQTTSY